MLVADLQKELKRNKDQLSHLRGLELILSDQESINKFELQKFQDSKQEYINDQVNKKCTDFTFKHDVFNDFI